MKTRQLSPTLIQLTRLGAVNAFLVRDADGFTLIDTLIPRSGAGVLAAARAAGAPIVRIGLTHAHTDHVGSVDELVAELGEVELAISARDARLLRGDKSLDPGEPQAKLRGGYQTLKRPPTRELAPGERFGPLEVVAAPGHTPGQVAFLDAREGTLLAGDAFSTLGGVATSSRPNPRFPFPALATWHRSTALASAQALRALAPRRLVVGHGGAVEDPGPAMDRAIARAQRG